MTVAPSTPPPGGEQIVAAALAQRREKTVRIASLIGVPMIGAPLPMYNIRYDQTQRQDPVKAAQLVGWRYPIIGGEKPGLAHLSPQADGDDYAGLTHGYLPERLLAAARLAEERLGDSPDIYEPRLLQIPSLNIIALWMAGSADKFILLTAGSPGSDGPPLIVDDVRPVIEQARLRQGPALIFPPDTGPSSGDLRGDVAPGAV